MNLSRFGVRRIHLTQTSAENVNTAIDLTDLQEERLAKPTHSILYLYDRRVPRVLSLVPTIKQTSCAAARSQRCQTGGYTRVDWSSSQVSLDSVPRCRSTSSVWAAADWPYQRLSFFLSLDLLQQQQQHLITQESRRKPAIRPKMSTRLTTSESEKPSTNEESTILKGGSNVSRGMRFVLLNFCYAG